MDFNIIEALLIQVLAQDPTGVFAEDVIAKQSELNGNHYRLLATKLNKNGIPVGSKTFITDRNSFFVSKDEVKKSLFSLFYADLPKVYSYVFDVYFKENLVVVFDYDVNKKAFVYKFFDSNEAMNFMFTNQFTLERLVNQSKGKAVWNQSRSYLEWENDRQIRANSDCCFNAIGDFFSDENKSVHRPKENNYEYRVRDKVTGEIIASVFKESNDSKWTCSLTKGVPVEYNIGEPVEGKNAKITSIDGKPIASDLAEGAPHEPTVGVDMSFKKDRTCVYHMKDGKVVLVGTCNNNDLNKIIGVKENEHATGSNPNLELI